MVNNIDIEHDITIFLLDKFSQGPNGYENRYKVRICDNFNKKIN